MTITISQRKSKKNSIKNINCHWHTQKYQLFKIDYGHCAKLKIKMHLHFTFAFRSHNCDVLRMQTEAKKNGKKPLNIIICCNKNLRGLRTMISFVT